MYRYQTKHKILSLLLVFSLLILTTVLVFPSPALAQDGEWVWWQTPPGPPIELVLGQPFCIAVDENILDKLILEIAPPPGPVIPGIEFVVVDLKDDAIPVKQFALEYHSGVGWSLVSPPPGIVVNGTPDGHTEVTFDPPVQVTNACFFNAMFYPVTIGLIQFFSPNQAPVADADGPYSGSVGSSISFNGSASYDPDEPYGDAIVSWEWDLNGDGQYDDASGEIVQKSWGSPYSGSIGLNVTDTLGAWDTDETRVNVTPAPTPPPVTEVGGEVYPVNNLAILAPWIALSAAIITGAIIAMKRRRARC